MGRVVLPKTAIACFSGFKVYRHPLHSSCLRMLLVGIVHSKLQTDHIMN